TTTGLSLAGAVAALSAARKGSKEEVVVYQKVSVGTGKSASNPWLLEMPDPVTRATWDNYIMISMAKAKQLGIDFESTEYEYYQDKPLIEITVNNRKLQLPVLIIPGMDPNT